MFWILFILGLIVQSTPWHQPAETQDAAETKCRLEMARKLLQERGAYIPLTAGLSSDNDVDAAPEMTIKHCDDLKLETLSRLAMMRQLVQDRAGITLHALPPIADSATRAIPETLGDTQPAETSFDILGDMRAVETAARQTNDETANRTPSDAPLSDEQLLHGDIECLDCAVQDIDLRQVKIRIVSVDANTILLEYRLKNNVLTRCIRPSASGCLQIGINAQHPNGASIDTFDMALMHESDRKIIRLRHLRRFGFDAFWLRVKHDDHILRQVQIFT